MIDFCVLLALLSTSLSLSGSLSPPLPPTLPEPSPLSPIVWLSSRAWSWSIQAAGHCCVNARLRLSQSSEGRSPCLLLDTESAALHPCKPLPARPAASNCVQVSFLLLLCNLKWPATQSGLVWIRAVYFLVGLARETSAADGGILFSGGLD